MKLAKEKGIDIVLNPAPAVPLHEDVYRRLGHLIVNETEAAILSGVEGSKSLSDWDKVAGVFISRGVQNIIITLGADVGFHSFRFICSLILINLSRGWYIKRPIELRSLNKRSRFRRKR